MEAKKVKSKTVFIIGAGASAELGFPVGDKLKEQIADKLSGDHVNPQTPFSSAVFSIMQSEKKNKYEDFYRLRDNIKSGIANFISIDNYVHANKKHDYLVKLCKLGIVESILKAEKEASIPKYDEKGNKVPNSKKLYNPDLKRAQPENIFGAWHLRLGNLLTQNIDNVDALAERLDNLAFVVFNYDRCLELYLYSLVLTAFEETTPDQAAKIVNNIEIYHPYGSIANLPELANQNYWEFGENSSSAALLELIKNIKTFTEQTTDSKSIKPMRDTIATAQQLIFLGFGFIDLNMELLVSKKSHPDHRPKYEKGDDYKILSTGCKLSEDKRLYINRVIEQNFIRNPNNEVKVNDIFQGKELTCSQLFDQYGHRFMI